MHFAGNRLGRRLEAALTIVRFVRLLVTVATVLPAAADIGAAGLETALLLAVVGSAAALLALLGSARGIRLLVQRTLFAFTTARLGSSLLLGLLSSLGGGSSGFGLLAHRSQVGFAGLLFLELALLDFTQTIEATGFLFAGLEFLLANDAGTVNGAAHRCSLRRFDSGRLDDFGFRLGLGLGLWLRFRLGFRFRLDFDNRLRDDLDHRLRHRLRRDFCQGLDDILLFGSLGSFRVQFVNIALDQHALLAHFDLNGPGTTMGVGGLDLRGLLARQGDLVLGLGFAVRTAQIVEQAGFVLVGQRIAAPGLADTGAAKLLEQRLDRHFEFNGKL